MDPNNGYAWSGLGTCILINVQDLISLDKPLATEATDKLAEALACFDKALDDGLEKDAVVLNARANVLNLWRRWPEAIDAYVIAVKYAPQGFASLARQNLALARLEDGDAKGAEKEAASLLLRDPEFIDARALLAALRWDRGDQAGAENAWSEICQGVQVAGATNALGKAVQEAGKAVGISKYVPRAGGLEFCQAYSKMSGVKGRWPPKALALYQTFLNRRNQAD